MKKFALLIAMIGIALAATVNAGHIPSYVTPGGTDVTGDITTSQTWPAWGSPYHLRGVIYVTPGATLTIEAGTVIANYKKDSSGAQPDRGALVVNRGAKIYAKGERGLPVIFTSAEDVATWDGAVEGDTIIRNGSDPNDVIDIVVTDPNNNWVLAGRKSGTWRAVCKEWGSLAICGNGYISASRYKFKRVTNTIDDDGEPGGSTTDHTNVVYPDCENRKRMEGTVARFTGDPGILYGGCDDDDNSGALCFVSLRYGGRALEDTDELNGLSLGAIGRGTDICHIEVMNNVDDGVELWGGTVNLKYLNIWNIGDDSLDFDEGWRGCAQYGLIVQGYSGDYYQGSGVGDNCFEMDGAEDANAQPRTTVKICNFTVVGQPGHPTDGNYPGGDGGTVWRDNARVQFAKCIWMDLDDELVKFDNADGDGAKGYDATANPGDKDGSKLVDNNPADGTLNWYEHWGVSVAQPHGKPGWTFNEWIDSEYGKLHRGPDDNNLVDANSLYREWMCCGYNPDIYLCAITDSIFYNNPKYSMSDAVGVSGPNNVWCNRTVDDMPIQELQRAALIQVVATGDEGTKTYGIAPVTWINPCAANDALTNTDCFSCCRDCCCDRDNAVMPEYVGGFSGCYNWLECWTAADAFGMTDTSMNDQNGDINCDGEINLFDLAEFADDYLL